jgi:hypothetical protein
MVEVCRWWRVSDRLCCCCCCRAVEVVDVRGGGKGGRPRVRRIVRDGRGRLDSDEEIPSLAAEDMGSEPGEEFDAAGLSLRRRFAVLQGREMGYKQKSWKTIDKRLRLRDPNRYRTVAHLSRATLRNIDLLNKNRLNKVGYAPRG